MNAPGADMGLLAWALVWVSVWAWLTWRDRGRRRWRQSRRRDW